MLRSHLFLSRSEKFHLVMRDLMSQLFLRLEMHGSALLEESNGVALNMSAPPTPSLSASADASP